MSFTNAEATSATLTSILTSTSLPGLTFTPVSRKGPLLPTPLTAGDHPPKAVYWIASCTKLITAIACLQLVEKSILHLDDPAHLATLLPELASIPVLKPDGSTEPQKQPITLRMLLTHTAGFGYTFFNERLRDWSLPVGVDEFSGDAEDILRLPLVFQPGEGWEYGVSLDWAGLAVERASKKKLGVYMHDHIFAPLGLEDISMTPTPSMKKRLVKMYQRLPDGTLSPRDHLHRRALSVSSTDNIFHSGGAGLFSTAEDYGRILSVLLNNGTDPLTNTTILQKSTVDEMYKNQIPHIPGFSKQPIPASKPTLTNAIPQLYPNGDNPQGWGLSFMISGGPTGRSEGTGWWAGLANLYWWADRERGVGGILAGQLLPFADLEHMGTWGGLEKTVYDGLA